MASMESAVFRQLMCVCGVREFIRDVLSVFLPGNWTNLAISDSNDAFMARIDEALAEDGEESSDSDACRRKIVAALCDEVVRLGSVLRDVCEGLGYGEYARRYLSYDKFVRLLMRADKATLDRLKRTLSDPGRSPIDILRDIGAALDGKDAGERGELGEPERGAANGEIVRIADGMRAALVQIGTIGENVAALRDNVSALKSGRRKPGSGRRIPDEKAVAVETVWENYKARPGSENTRPTLLGAFKYGATALAKVMILDIKDFKRVCAVLRKRRQRALEREREARKAEKTATNRAGNGIIHGMKQGLRTAASIALATTCAAAAPLRPETKMPSIRVCCPTPVSCQEAGMSKPCGIETLHFCQGERRCDASANPLTADEKGASGLGETA